MNIDIIGQYATEVLALVLIFRLLWLADKRSGVYTLFVAFLASQLLGSIAFFACRFWTQLDYRVAYFAVTAVLAVFSLLLSYSLAKAVLAELPGFLRFSRIFLNIVFAVAVVLAFSTAKTEYQLVAAQHKYSLFNRLIYFALVADKGISMASVIVLIAILIFILWFPVRMSRNLALFSIGLVVFFTAKSLLKLLALYSASATRVIDLSVSGVLILCFLYWIIFIDAKGKEAQVRIGHGWHREEQQKLIAQLESMNAALMRSTRITP